MMDSSENDVEGFTDDSPFVRLLGTEGRVRIIDVLLRQHTNWMTPGEICDAARISNSTFSRNKDVLLELGILNQRKQGNSTLYRVNVENDVVNLLGRFHTELLSYSEEIIASTDDEAPDQVKEIIEILRQSSSEKAGETRRKSDEELSRTARELMMAQ